MIEKTVTFAECSDCGSPIRVRVWGEGVDAEVWCDNDDCENKDIYR